MRPIKFLDISNGVWLVRTFAVGALAGFGVALALSLTTANVQAQTAAPDMAGTKPTIIDTERAVAAPPVSAEQAQMQPPATGEPVAPPAAMEPTPPMASPADQKAMHPGQPADMAPPAATEPPMQAAVPATPPTKMVSKSGRDSEGRAVLKYHPLQTARPDRNIVVCEAGCEGTRVVFDGKQSVPAGDITPSAVTDQPIATCRGGCYENAPGHTWAGYDPSRKPALGGYGSIVAPKLLDGDGRWMSNVTPGVIAAPVAAQQSKPKAKREDWMSRINREREAEKAAKAAAVQ